MGRSIRGRLVGSYVLTTLLSVAVMGGLGLSLVAQIGRLRARQELSRSASAIAEQAAPWIEEAPVSPMLAELARGAAFLLDARVRIVDAESSLLAEARADSGNLRLLWLAGAEPGTGFVSSKSHVRPPAIPLDTAAAVRTGPAVSDEERFGTEDLEPVETPSGQPWVFALRRGTEGALAGNVHIELIRDGRFARRITRTMEIRSAVPQLEAITDVESVTIADRLAPPVGALDGGTPVGRLDIFHAELGLGDQALDRMAGLIAGQTGPAARARSDEVIRVPIGEMESPLGYVEVSQAPDDHGPNVSSTARAFGLAAFGATLLAALVGVWMSRGMSRPLAELDEAAGRMGGGDLAARARVGSEDEIGRLAERFNDMASRLERSFSEIEAERDALRRFVADASHELRTPITALGTYNSLLQSELEDPAERQDFLGEQARQIDRLAWITENLLDLSRLDAGLVELGLETCRAEDLLEAAVEPHRSGFDEAGTRIELEVGPDLPDLIADPERARIALGNLVENSLKFASGSAQLTLRVVEAPGSGGPGPEAGLRFEIEDQGPGVNRVERERVFERFHRGADTAGLPGSGLGLAIVRGIARRHGGQAWLETGHAGGTRACLWLPLVPPASD